jgi:hypothetical protein
MRLPAFSRNRIGARQLRFLSKILQRSVPQIFLAAQVLHGQ